MITIMEIAEGNKPVSGQSDPAKLRKITYSPKYGFAIRIPDSFDNGSVTKWYDRGLFYLYTSSDVLTLLEKMENSGLTYVAAPSTIKRLGLKGIEKVSREAKYIKSKISEVAEIYKKDVF